jgi:hypothetical protein
MKRLIIALAAIGAVVALGPVMKRKAQRMREHCEQMAARCTEKMSRHEGGEEAGMPEHPEPTVVESGDRGEALSTA